MCRHGSKRVRFAFGRVSVNDGGSPGVMAWVTRVGNDQKTRNPLTEVKPACPDVNQSGVVDCSWMRNGHRYTYTMCVLFSFRLIVDLSPEVVSPVKYFNRHWQKIDFPACQENQGCPLPLPEPIKNVITVDIFTQPDLIFTFGQIWVGTRNRH